MRECNFPAGAALAANLQSDADGALAWEIGHVMLYTIWMEADGLRIAWSLFHCSLGDVLIALEMFALAGIALRRADWPRARGQAAQLR